MIKEFKILSLTKKLVTLESTDKEKTPLQIGCNKNQHITEIWATTKKIGDKVELDVELSDSGRLYLNEGLAFWERSQRIQRIQKENKYLDLKIASFD